VRAVWRSFLRKMSVTGVSESAAVFVVPESHKSHVRVHSTWYLMKRPVARWLNREVVACRRSSSVREPEGRLWTLNVTVSNELEQQRRNEKLIGLVTAQVMGHKILRK
jgi:hypothetical protein